MLKLSVAKKHGNLFLHKNVNYKYIYSGFIDGEGNYIFGAFTWRYDWESERLCYEKFAGLLLVNSYTLETTAVPPEGCSDYPMSMEAIYKKPAFESAVNYLFGMLM